MMQIKNIAHTVKVDKTARRKRSHDVHTEKTYIYNCGVLKVAGHGLTKEGYVWKCFQLAPV